MEYPSFYDKVEKFIFFDELASFLGATKDGKIEISYLDCVKLAGHSCPTVAGSYILAKEAKEALNVTKRSSLKINFKDSKSSGVTGVIANIVGFIFGCSDEGGFSGIGGRFNRANLITFDNDIEGFVEFETLDGSSKVQFNLDTSAVPPNLKIKDLMQKSITGVASKEEFEEFQKLWQSRVEEMLLNKENWDKIAKKI